MSARNGEVEELSAMGEEYVFVPPPALNKKKADFSWLNAVNPPVREKPEKLSMPPIEAKNMTILQETPVFNKQLQYRTRENGSQITIPPGSEVAVIGKPHKYADNIMVRILTKSQYCLIPELAFHKPIQNVGQIRQKTKDVVLKKESASGDEIKPKKKFVTKYIVYGGIILAAFLLFHVLLTKKSQGNSATPQIQPQI